MFNQFRGSDRPTSGSVSIFAVLFVALGPPLGAQAPWPTEQWSVSTAAEEGLKASPIDSLDARIEAGGYGLIDRLVVVKNGYLVANHSYPRDYREVSRGQRTPVGCGIDACLEDSEVHQYNYLHPDFHPFASGKNVHSLQSITKSVTSALVGIAISRGVLPGVDSPLLPLLKDYDTSNAAAGLQNATLEDLLTMRLGMEWHESDRPADSTNTTFAMELSDDWVEFTLKQSMDTEPGDSFNYNSGGSHLMSAILKTATGLTADKFAERFLFGPLGIEDYHWKIAPEGLPDTEGGLYLEALDLAKIGYLYLKGGVWDEKRILPEAWIEASTTKQADRFVGPAGAEWGYGYKWWRVDQGETIIWAGLGFGGQYLFVLPQHDLVAVVNSWNLFGRPQGNIFAATVAALRSAVAP